MQVQVVQIVVESHQQTLCQVDVFCRNNQSQGECSQYEDQYGYDRTDDNGFYVIFSGRLLNIHNVDTHHFHTGIK